MSTTSPSSAWTLLQWQEAGQERSALWRAESAMAQPRRITVVDDTLAADAAYKLACAGTTMLWRGDFQNARLLLGALTRRLERPARKSSAKLRHQRAAAASQAADPAPVFPQAFHAHRLAQSQRARVLSSILVELDAQWHCALRRAPDWQQACVQAWGEVPQDAGRDTVLVPLRELLGAVGAFEWRKKGVEVPQLGGNPPERIHPYYGVYSPVRGEYLDMILRMPLPVPTPVLAFDIGVGTGVLSALLLKRGLQRIVATDVSAQALACAKDNLRRLGWQTRVQLVEADLFPDGQADLIVCNPPWLPARPTSLIEHAVYDEDSRMLRGFLQGLSAHLAPGGEGWLVLSDLAEHLGLRSRETLMQWFDEAGLKVKGREYIRPTHGKVSDGGDPLHAARAAEETSVWRLVPKTESGLNP